MCKFYDGSIYDPYEIHLIPYSIYILSMLHPCDIYVGTFVDQHGIEIWSILNLWEIDVEHI